MPRLVLIDDHLLFRQGLRALLGAHSDLDVVGDVGDAREGYALVEKLAPDVVLLDVSLGGVGGIAAARELRRRTPQTRVLVVTMHDSIDVAEEAFAAGASGYALKTEPAEALVAAVRAISRGDRYLAPVFPRRLLEAAPPRGGALGRLSPREVEIFDMIVRGHSTGSIATQLCISAKTVETHRASINRKLGVHSSAELVRYAMRHGLVAT